MSKKKLPENLPEDAEIAKFELGEIQPLYFKRPDSEKLFGIPPRVLEDLAMQKRGPPYFRRGKYSIYSVPTFIKWLTEKPVKTTDGQ